MLMWEDEQSKHEYLRKGLIISDSFKCKSTELVLSLLQHHMEANRSKDRINGTGWEGKMIKESLKTSKDFVKKCYLVNKFHKDSLVGFNNLILAKDIAGRELSRKKQRCLCYFPRAAVTWWFKTTKVYSLTVLEVRRSKRRCQQNSAVSEGSKGWFSLAFFWCLVPPGISCLWQWLPCLCIHMVFSPVFLCVLSSFYKNTSHHI